MTDLAGEAGGNSSAGLGGRESGCPGAASAARADTGAGTLAHSRAGSANTCSSGAPKNSSRPQQGGQWTKTEEARALIGRVI